MADQQKPQLIEYTCQGCSYRNVWSYKEVLQRGKKEIYKNNSIKEDYYSLPCKNPARPQCLERYTIAIEREGK